MKVSEMFLDEMPWIYPADTRVSIILHQSENDEGCCVVVGKPTNKKIIDYFRHDVRFFTYDARSKKLMISVTGDLII